MKTLFERSTEWAGNNYKLDMSIKSLMEISYINGAADQHTIDVEKACAWMAANLDKYVPAFVNGMLETIQLDDLINNFRKSMEE